MTRLPQTTMVSPIDTAWDVIKGEAFHPSVAGYMAAGHGGERDQAILQEMRRIEEMYGSVPLNAQEAQAADDRYMELEDSLSDDPHALESMRAARPNAQRENRPRMAFDFPFDAYGRASRTVIEPSTHNMPPKTMRSADRDLLRLRMYNAGRGKPVGPTGELDTFGHLSDEPIGLSRTDTQILSDRHDREQEFDLRRSSDSPIDTAWSILKELSREDLQHAARTGGIPMTEARRQAYEDEGLPLSTGGGFRTMPDTEAQLMMETQRRFRQGGGNLPPGMTDERFERMGMEDVRSNQVHDADEFGDPNFEPESDSLEPEGRMGFNLAHASLEDPSFAERYDPEPEIDPELSQFQTGTTPSNPFELAIHSIEQKRRQKAYEQHLLQQQRQRMAQAQRPQMSQSSRVRRPGESKNAYRRRMSRRR